MTATTSNNGLSAGAIAGIVIGVLAGLFFLFIICAILCCKGLIDGILDFFGLRSRKNKRETYVEEEHRHSGRTWYGAQKPTTITEKKKKEEWRHLWRVDRRCGRFGPACYCPRLEETE